MFFTHLCSIAKCPTAHYLLSKNPNHLKHFKGQNQTITSWSVRPKYSYFVVGINYENCNVSTLFPNDSFKHRRQFQFWIDLILDLLL